MKRLGKKDHEMLETVQAYCACPCNCNGCSCGCSNNDPLDVSLTSTSSGTLNSSSDNYTTAAVQY